MSRLSIPVRLVLLVAVLGVMMFATNAYLSRQLSDNSDAIAEEAELVEILTIANGANAAFGSLKHWLTDLAVSLLMNSERNAYAARDALMAELDRLDPHAPKTVALIRVEVEGLMTQSLDAVDAYSDDQRVLGNSLMAAGRQHIQAIDTLLSDMVLSLIHI